MPMSQFPSIHTTVQSQRIKIKHNNKRSSSKNSMANESHAIAHSKDRLNVGDVADPDEVYGQIWAPGKHRTDKSMLPSWLRHLARPDIPEDCSSALSTNAGHDW
ncbi:hypothetical protein BAUCODRAFT_394773 [Baudoinia panamericana UAMH 10762]|uniref:Uncharacterized protein n=1 Tax=Baudoinia panamericana (strain UAMH 10762) TaxID=717646 RepID=M2NJ86_BAUPA|nr:uncharacterized protein BAUCODRAFT_394773 [Baudoinia panamericana UAMH 10762]EMC99195.1 hypothetical protein BAUCODRAFT_394773 [Baudoinia panamericana UAMH 10762]